MPLLDVSNLSVSYGRGREQVSAVDRVSFSLDPGETLAIVGESGSGKSSVVLALTRLLASPPAQMSADHVMFEGSDLLRVSEDQLRAIRGGRIAYIFQEPGTSLNPVLTIGEQLREAIEQHTTYRSMRANAQAVEWLERVGLPSARARLGAYPHEFSGGMQQRVMIAMAIATKPALLIADEPTTALDVTIQVQILRLIRDLTRQLHLSMLLISHDLTVVERIAQRVAIMSAGRIVELGPVAEVFTRPRHPYTKELLACRSSVTLRRKRPSHG